MNIYEINFQDKLEKYKVIKETTSAIANRTTKDIMIELSKETIIINLVSGEGHPIKMNFKGNTFLDIINEYRSDEDLDKYILLNSEIYHEIKNLLDVERIVTNTIIIDKIKFNNVIENSVYRMDCFQKISEFISTYYEHPSETDLTLFLVGMSGRLLSEFLYENGLGKYSREMNGYSITFNESLNESDHFKMDFIEFCNGLGIAGTTLALDYL